MAQFYFPGDAVPGQVLYPKKFSAGTNYNATGTLIPKVPNLIYNGAFSNGLAGWTAKGSTANMNLDTGWNLYGGSGAIWQGLANGTYQGNAIPIVSGRQYYFCGWAYFQTGAYDLFACLIDGPGNPYWITGNQAVKNQWQFASRIVTTTSAMGATLTPQVGVWGDGRDVSAHYDGFMLIDLTDSFGPGKEPDKATMDAIVQANGGFWDSVVALSVTIQPSYGNVANYVGDPTHIYVRLFRGLYTEGSPGTGGQFPEVVLNDPNFIAGNIRGTVFGLAGTAKQYAKGVLPKTGGFRAVNGLTFKPRIILMEDPHDGSTNFGRYIYFEPPDGDPRFNNLGYGTYPVVLDSQYSVNFNVYLGGFSINSPSTTGWSWYAWE
ncbi:hypothetical protein SAMN05216312_12212 [Cohnella sp. OV330]|uniref:hypothetical protein n=1 Tax=Cohnella sp. OV330 TaxID=1855288 RepID=UPI0008EF9147|nr:hypothetical protein [Cohnella sp. OV330]SFB62534.1 hypothetical protein SAMN05216312_12212 [Cohnella sp. OV330]